ncbi:MAG: PilW family protein [Acidithiobacillus sp.]|nr:PilW family protein [Acidithiobacillus sp.]
MRATKEFLASKADRQFGLSLVELLVALAVVGLLSTAIFSFFLHTSQGVSQQSANGEMWQRGRNAMAIMRQAIESAGYGLPSYSQCPNGVVGNTSTGSPAALVAITASPQSSGSSYDPSSSSGISTYAFSTVIGGGSFGGAPATTVTGNRGGGHSENIPVASTQALQVCDYVLLTPSGGSGACLAGQITNLPSNAVGLNSGKSCGTSLSLNPNQIFLTPLPGSNGSTTTIGAGASLYNLGFQNFLFQQFQIMETPAGSTPTLYMTQYTGAQAAAPAPQALASGVVDIQMLYGLGTNGSVQSWVAPEKYTPSATQSIVAVQLAMLIRSTRYLPNSLSPASFDILGQTYTVPTSGGPGCLQGNCRHYEYHLFQSIIPVRNGIWGEQ